MPSNDEAPSAADRFADTVSSGQRGYSGYGSTVAYDVVVESRRLLEEGVPDVPFRLSRRRRFIPVARDVDGDVAATLFVRRGVSGNPWLESWTLERRGGDWAVVGGGSGDGHDDVFESRDAVDVAVLYGRGWSSRNADRLLPWPSTGVSYATMRLGSNVACLQLAQRQVEVPVHGLAIVVWASRRPPALWAHTADGEVIAELPLADKRRLRAPWRGRGGWFEYKPHG
jgi:hypothetical protein